MLKFRASGVFAATLFLVTSGSVALGQPVVPEVEESDIATLPAMAPHWALAMNAWIAGTRIVDGDSGKIIGALHTIPLSNVAVDPNKRFFYVAETIWTKGNRGTRQDMLTVYDGNSLKIVAEIPLPGRLLTGNRIQDLAISADGRFAYIYDMSPASSVIVVDLVKRKVSRTIELPGCALAFAAPGERIMSLCSDGSIATVSHATKKNEVVQTEPFFSAEDDPIFDNGILDPATGKGLFLSYSGLIYEVSVGDQTKVAPAWSIQEAAGMPAGSTKPLQLSWLPGGRQMMAYHAGLNQLYVLMHSGEFWSQKESGSELWVVDIARRKVVSRRPLEPGVDYMTISQDEKPLLFLSGGGEFRVMDAATFETKHRVDGLGYGTITMVGR